MANQPYGAQPDIIDVEAVEHGSIRHSGAQTAPQGEQDSSRNGACARSAGVEDGRGSFGQAAVSAGFHSPAHDAPSRCGADGASAQSWSASAQASFKGWEAPGAANASAQYVYTPDPRADTHAGKRASRRMAGFVQFLGGGVLATVGVPMLILPGPGLLAIVAGTAIAIGGLIKIVRG